ncbi:hypothetical protein DI272_21615 [Streptomyces sp. Act143]|uniref:hypothetical protein n=1 Tax=Streptomyces sp. Act143 TaxID=2200760 RepID=UPI000D678A8F|nr:hypothetical protein [Streptomyces sp. Act143]PWI16477.1 hypothetical protein DI272_21615 [Streptomyces sp. Act143]
MSNLGRRLLTTAGAGAAAIVLAATPALADADTSYYADTVASGSYLSQAGTMRFDSLGDKFNACDNWSDGAGVIGYWKVGSGGTVHSLYNGGGIGTCATSNQDLAESATVYIKACLRDDGDVKEGTCSAWEKGYADGIP